MTRPEWSANRKVKEIRSILNVSLGIGRRFTEMNMMRKGQVKRLNGSNAMRQAKFIQSLFQIAAWQRYLQV
jgi:hypothetical protein